MSAGVDGVSLAGPEESPHPHKDMAIRITSKVDRTLFICFSSFYL